MNATLPSNSFIARSFGGTPLQKAKHLLLGRKRRPLVRFVPGRHTTTAGFFRAHQLAERLARAHPVKCPVAKHGAHVGALLAHTRQVVHRIGKRHCGQAIHDASCARAQECWVGRCRAPCYVDRPTAARCTGRQTNARRRAAFETAMRPTGCPTRTKSGNTASEPASRAVSGHTARVLRRLANFFQKIPIVVFAVVRIEHHNAPAQLETPFNVGQLRAFGERFVDAESARLNKRTQNKKIE